MTYTATVYNVMIASPSDVANERRIAYDVIVQWNAVHAGDRRIALMPMGWEKNASPELGDRPQEILNRQILENADLLIAIFWTRLGSPTGEAPSGTVEEIEKHMKAGKPAMVYFSSVPVPPESLDERQYGALKAFRAKIQKIGLHETYSSPDEFRQKLTRQLTQTANRLFVAKTGVVGAPDSGSASQMASSLSGPAKELLLETAAAPGGGVNMFLTVTGLSVKAGTKEFVKQGESRSEARWEAATRELCREELVREHSPNCGIFSITDDGYQVADALRASA